MDVRLIIIILNKSFGYFTMEIVSLLPAFFEATRLGDDTLYTAAFPDFFSYYNTYWQSKEGFTSVDPVLLTKREKVFLQLLDNSSQRFAAAGLDLGPIKALIMIGDNVANGHAFMYEHTPIAWFAIESFESEATARVFIAHELAHALYYQYQPLSYFTTKDEQRTIHRLFITEGIATYVSKEILGIDDGQALWADTLDEQALSAWMQTCHLEIAELYRVLYNNFNASGSELKLFWAADPSSVYMFRAGYYAALKFIESYVKSNHLSLADLLKIDYPTLVKEAYLFLQQYR